ncbi:MAG: hypothetical protein K0A93_12315 [Desulfuromonadaceae bacterium]|nr:hypothetical protein [Desulfuromonadaceae bacterium]
MKMRILISTISLLSILLLGVTTSFAASFWKVQDATAQISFTIKEGKDSVLCTFVVALFSDSKCQSKVGFILSNIHDTDLDTDLGDFVGSSKSTVDMVLELDGDEYSGETYLFSYTNATESVMYGTPEILNKIKESRSVLIRFSGGEQALSLPIEGAKAAINKASQNCYNHKSSK